MQFVDTDFLAKLRQSARDLIVLYEIYEADYDGTLGFNPLDALQLFAGQSYSFTHLAQTVSYRREILEHAKINKTINKQINSVSVTVSNVSRYMSDWVLSTEVQGLRFVVRAISR